MENVTFFCHFFARRGSAAQLEKNRGLLEARICPFRNEIEPGFLLQVQLLELHKSVSHNQPPAWSISKQRAWHAWSMHVRQLEAARKQA